MRGAQPWVPQAEGQAGAFSRAQASAAGLTNKRLATAVRRGLLEQPFRDVFTVVGRHSALTGDWAALLAAGRTAVLAAWSAARALHMVWPQRPHGPACLALPPGEHRRLAGVVMLRHGLRACDVLTAPGRPATTTRPRTVVDCLRLAPRALRGQMLDEALYQRWLSVDDLVDQAHAVHGQHGAPVLRELLRGVASGARSAAERLAQKVLARSGIGGWLWNHPVVLPDGTIAVLDAALPELRIAVEIDGRGYHSAPAEFQHDRTRQNALVAAGWIVLRFTWYDLKRRPDYVVAAVGAAARSRAS